MSTIIEFMSFCFPEKEPNYTIERRRVIDPNEDFLRKYMGRIELIKPCNKKLSRNLKNSFTKMPILDQNTPILCLMNDGCVNGASTQNQFEYLADLIDSIKDETILLDISSEIDHQHLSKLLRKSSHNNYLISVQFNTFKELTQMSTIFEFEDLSRIMKKNSQKLEQTKSIINDIHRVYCDSVLVEAKDNKLKLDLLDQIILIPFCDSTLEQIIDPLQNQIPFKCKLYLLQILTTYATKLNRVTLILPIVFPIQDLIVILSQVLDLGNLSEFNSFIHIQSIYSSSYRKIQLVVKFGIHEKFIENQVHEFIINKIFSDEILNQAYHGMSGNDKQSIFQWLHVLDHCSMMSVLTYEKNRVDKFCSQLTNCFDSPKEIRAVKRILQQAQISASQQVSIRSLSPMMDTLTGKQDIPNLFDFSYESGNSFQGESSYHIVDLKCNFNTLETSQDNMQFKQNIVDF